ncbi:hypothetical protein [Archangium lipolyticum]|uniref:hypothetical protein n=1 Tax=Archangium lipolyticum TaxID=2970465 RepID=UPI00214A151A|nr:hypothetical protein [Archangium lipolyticum]
MPRLVEEARAASGAERQALAARLNRELEALELEEGSREVADLLLHLLESGQLEGLEAAEGRTCRGVAVETLLGLGYPYALEVRPEDLEYLRNQSRPNRKGLLPEGALGAGVLAAGFVGEWMLRPSEMAEGERALGLSLFFLMALTGLVAALWGDERSDTRRAGLLGLLVLSVVQLYLGTLGGYYGTLSGVGGLLAWLLLLLPRR